jgi:hypothetical protein
MSMVHHCFSISVHSVCYYVFTCICSTILYLCLQIYGVFLVMCHIFCLLLIFLYKYIKICNNTSILCYDEILRCSGNVIYLPSRPLKILWSQGGRTRGVGIHFQIVYSTQNYWVFGLCPSSGILEARMEWPRLTLSKGPNRVGVLAPHLRTETNPVSKTSCFTEFIFRIWKIT